MIGADHAMTAVDVQTLMNPTVNPTIGIDRQERAYDPSHRPLSSLRAREAFPPL